MHSGYVAFLDIMGFSSLVSGERHAERINNYLDCLRGILEVKTETPQVEYVVFSDSIVVTTADDADASLQALLERCSSLFGALLRNEIPVRGAISHGTYSAKRPIAGGLLPDVPLSTRINLKVDKIGSASVSRLR